MVLTIKRFKEIHDGTIGEFAVSYPYARKYFRSCWT